MRIDEIGRQPCPVAGAMAQIGDAWSWLILREALYGRRRFSDFVRHTGAQRTVVSARLKKLVGAGILRRVEYSQHPTRHHYLLTDKGRALAPVMLALAEWGSRWPADSDRGARSMEFTHSCGHPVDATVVCGVCQQPLRAVDVAPSFGTAGRPAAMFNPEGSPENQGNHGPRASL